MYRCHAPSVHLSEYQPGFRGAAQQPEPQAGPARGPGRPGPFPAPAPAAAAAPPGGTASAGPQGRWLAAGLPLSEETAPGPGRPWRRQARPPAVTVNRRRSAGCQAQRLVTATNFRVSGGDSPYTCIL